MHPGATATLLSTPSYYSTKSSGGLADLQKQFIHIGRMDGSGGAWPLDLDLHQQIHKGTRGPSARMTDVTSRGPSHERAEGLFPCSAPGQLTLLPSAAAGRNANGCLPHCFCESQENKPRNFRLLATNFYGPHTRVQRPSGAPCPRFENLGEQGLGSGFIGTDPTLQEGTHSHGRWGLPFKSLWPVVINREAKAEGSKGGGALRAQVKYLRFQQYLEETFIKDPTFKHILTKCALSLLTRLHLKPCAGRA